MFACWMRVLAQVPGSVLWTSIEWPQAKARLQAFAAGQGIDPERLEFAPVIAPQAHLARLPAADLFPDCFPYSAGATAGQCVGQGVPLIALTGETYVSRIATAVLHAVGCDELAVSSIEDYERLAVRLGRSDAERIAWRARVRSSVGEARMFQPAAMATAVETACASLWHAFCNSARHDVLYDNPRAGEQRDLPPGRQALP